MGGPRFRWALSLGVMVALDLEERLIARHIGVRARDVQRAEIVLVACAVTGRPRRMREHEFAEPLYHQFYHALYAPHGPGIHGVNIVSPREEVHPSQPSSAGANGGSSR